MALSKFEKRLSIFALVFVVIYLGAAALTIQSNYFEDETVLQLESERLTPAEGRLLMVELFLVAGTWSLIRWRNVTQGSSL